MKRAFSLLLLMFTFSVLLDAQEIIFENYQGKVDFWVLLPYNTFIFKKNADTAQYQLSIEITNKDKKQVLDWNQNLSVPKREWLQNTALPVFFQTSLDAGKYNVGMRLKNTILGDKYDIKKSFVLEEKSTEIGQAYLIAKKEGIEYLPSVLSKLPVSVEKCEIRQKFSVIADSIHIACGDSIINFDKPQRELTANLTAWVNTGSVDKITISFYEENIRYDMQPFLYDQWFSYNARYSYKDQIEQLRYVANQNEWKSIRSVTEEIFPDIIERFWQRHDPTPGTIRNEIRESFYQRVMIADQRFTIHKRLKGWKSDRGRIYIKYGEPDETHAEVQPLDMYPYIIWIYYKNNLEFVFEDTGGFGQYKLRNKDEEY
jgi:GWxTD domain-containing protein